MWRGDAQKQTSKNLSAKLSQLSKAKSECSIYKVHDRLRNINDKAYEPEIIAIGPYHRDKSNLIIMEEHKLRYLQLILQRKNEHVEKFVSAIMPLEKEARECYAEPISLNVSQFVEMLVLDGCFIIDLVRKYNMTHWREQNDPIFQTHWMLNSLRRDLMLFENQIPFFVLCKLFDLIEAPNQHTRLIYLALCIFLNMNPGDPPTRDGQYTDKSSDEIKHLLDLIHSHWTPPFEHLPGRVEDATNGTEKSLQFIDCATRLREANVKFERFEKGTSLFNVRFENGCMSLPPLIIDDNTETFFRNMIAYEQYFRGKKFSSMTDYVLLLDCLIDSSSDVEILRRHRIIDNRLGDDEVVANMFNRITDSVTGPSKHFIYSEVFDEVNLHCKKRRNRWVAKLRHNYLNSPWAVISILAGTVLLFLTLAQTIFSAVQLV